MTVKSPNTIDQTVGIKIRERRLSLGMSQERLADQLGITFQQLQKYEKGANRISAGRLQQIAAALGSEISYFFKQSTFTEAADGKKVSAKALKLVTAFERIESTAIRESIVALAVAASPSNSD